MGVLSGQGNGNGLGANLNETSSISSSSRPTSVSTSEMFRGGAGSLGLSPVGDEAEGDGDGYDERDLVQVVLPGDEPVNEGHIGGHDDEGVELKYTPLIRGDRTPTTAGSTHFGTAQ